MRVWPSFAQERDVIAVMVCPITLSTPPLARREDAEARRRQALQRCWLCDDPLEVRFFDQYGEAWDGLP